MAIIKNYSNKEVKKDYPSIFLAGPTKRDGTLTEWRIEACEMLEKMGFGGVVYIPEYGCGEVFDSSKFEKQCLWEREALEASDCIVFWIPRNMNDMPAMTTNIEFGTYLQRKTDCTAYGHPQEAVKMKYLDWLYRYEKGPDAPIYETLADTLKSAVKIVEWKVNKRNFDKG